MEMSDDKFCSLDMLAEVASATLENDPALISSAQLPKNSNKINCCPTSRKSNCSEMLNFHQIKSLSDKMLIELFSELSCDEIRKNYSFKCFLMPDSCTQIFKSFGNEARARCKMKTHLLSHIKDLAEEENENCGFNFLAEPLHVRNKRLKELSPKSPRKKRKVKQNLKKKRESTWDLTPVKTECENSSKYHFPCNTSIETCTSTTCNHVTSITPDGSILSSTFPSYSDIFLHQESTKTQCVSSDTSNSITDVKSKSHMKHKKKQNGNSTNSQSDCVVDWNEDFYGNESCDDSSLLDCDNFIGKPISTPHHDHSYTFVYGKTFDCDLYQAAENYKNEFKSFKTSNKCTARKPPIVIPTPPFPYVYVPLLPHIAEIAEIGDTSMCSKCGNSFDDGNHENYTSFNTVSNSPATIDNESYYNLNKFLPSDENDPDSEDDSYLSDSFINEVVYENGVIHEISHCRTLYPLPHPPVSLDDLKPDCPENLQAFERKLALKYIRGLRTKKKEERGPLTCQICKNKSFTAQATLMYHYRSHAGIKPFSCSVCEATFTRQHSLNYHMLIHNNKSRFMCSDCGRNFRHPSHYKEHLRRHTGETPYECTDCDLRFKTRNTYKRHLKTRHGKILTAQGIKLLSIEEFIKVRTSPRRKTPQSPPLNLKDQEIPNDSTDSESCEMW